MKLKSIRGSYTAEASFVMIITIFTVMSVIVFSMFLHGRVCAAADTRAQVEMQQSQMLRSGELITKKTVQIEKTGIKITAQGTASYDETAEKTYINVPKSLRVMRLINLISEDD